MTQHQSLADQLREFIEHADWTGEFADLDALLDRVRLAEDVAEAELTSIRHRIHCTARDCGLRGACDGFDLLEALLYARRAYAESRKGDDRE